MTLATQYAHALRSLVLEYPAKSKELLGGLRATVAKRGHEKLLPQILREYEKLDTKEARVGAASTLSPERERTRVLFELYKKLIA
jgi:F0F1-type ATP synthase delta subunit